MNNDIFSDSITAIKDADFANNTSDNYKIISVRPGDKATALIDVMTEMNSNKLPLAKISDLISEELAAFTISRQEHVECLKNVAGQFRFFDQKSALGILLNAGALQRSKRFKMASLFATEEASKEEENSDKESEAQQ